MGKVEKRPGVPVMFVIQNATVLDKPSPKTVAFVKGLAKAAHRSAREAKFEATQRAMGPSEKS